MPRQRTPVRLRTMLALIVRPGFGPSGPRESKKGYHVMKKTISLATIGAALFLTSQSMAQSGAVQTKVDMSKITCAELAQSYLDEFVVVAAWMSGYYNAKKNNTLVDSDQLSSNAKKVAAACKQNPSMGVMQTIEKLSAESK